MVTNYAGITTTLSALIPDAITDQINIQGIGNLDINIGDYLQIDDEIVRVKTTTSTSSITATTNPIYVFRGVLGTRAVNHVINSVQSFVHRVIHLSMLDLVLVTIQLHSQINKIVRFLQ
jgi:hypothetical protein